MSGGRTYLMPIRGPDRLQSEMIFNLRQSFTNWLTHPQLTSLSKPEYLTNTGGVAHAYPLSGNHFLYWNRRLTNFWMSFAK